MIYKLHLNKLSQQRAEEDVGRVQERRRAPILRDKQVLEISKWVNIEKFTTRWAAAAELAARGVFILDKMWENLRSKFQIFDSYKIPIN